MKLFPLLFVFLIAGCVSHSPSMHNNVVTKTHDGHKAFVLQGYKPDETLGGFIFVIDGNTGCEYVDFGGALVPRAARDGIQKGCK